MTFGLPDFIYHVITLDCMDTLGIQMTRNLEWTNQIAITLSNASGMSRKSQRPYTETKKFGLPFVDWPYGWVK